MDECERQCDHGTLEAEDADGYASARHCDCEVGEALSAKEEAEYAPYPKRAAPATEVGK